MANLSGNAASLWSWITPTARVRWWLWLGTFFALLPITRGLLPFIFAFVAGRAVLTATQARMRVRWPRVTAAAAADLSAMLWAVLLVGIGTAIGPWLGSAVTEASTALPTLVKDIVAHPWMQRLLPWLPAEAEIVGAMQEHWNIGLSWAMVATKTVVLLVAGALVAIVAVREDATIGAWKDTFAPTSGVRTLWRWWGYALSGVEVMLTTQVLVASVNAILTLPLLYLVGLPQIPTLTALVFVASLIPVIGNIAMGLILALVALGSQGGGAAMAITGLTFVLHKVESYWINPRLAAPRIGVPSLLVIMALVVWERLLGFSGVFLAIPSLVLIQHLRTEWQQVSASQAEPPLSATPAPVVEELETSATATTAAAEPPLPTPDA